MAISSNILIVLVSAFLASVVGVRLTAAAATHIGFLDRCNHNTGNPGGASLGGGVAVSLIILATVLLRWIPLGRNAGIVIALAGATLLGLIDDIRALHPGAKVAGQAVCVAVYLASRDAGPGMWVWGGTFLIIAANAWNVVDVMDGLAGTIGVFALAGAGAVLVVDGRGMAGMAELALVGAAALAGFWFWNRPPARILLGDAGSIPLGMMFGIMIIEGWTSSPQVGVTIATAGLIPFFEVVFLIIERSRRQVPFYRVTPDHFALRLKRHGWSPQRILRPVAAIGAVLAILAVAMAAMSFNRYVLLAVYGSLMAGAIVAFLYLRRFAPESALP